MTHIDLQAQTDVQGTSQGLSAYVARPSTPEPWPGVVVVHEVFGIDGVMRRQVDRLAAAGYLAVMPDLFTHGGPRRCLWATFAALKKGEGRAFQDIEAARAWLVDADDCTGKIGVIGFCMGGAFALMVASRGGYDVAAPNYGLVPSNSDEALAAACPVVASYGGRDRALKGAAAKLEASLDRVGVPHDVKEYPAAGHCFLNDGPVGPRWMQPLFKVTHVGPEPESARDAWARIESYFDRHLRAD